MRSFRGRKCQECGRTQLIEILARKGQEPVVACSFCHAPMDKDQVRCLMDHRVRVDSWLGGAVLIPHSSLVDLIQKLINKYFQAVGFVGSHESFYIRNNIVHYSSRQGAKVMFKVQELNQFKRVWDRKISENRRRELAEVLMLLKEKCSKHSLEGCAAC